MNRHELETLLLRERDGALSVEQRAALDAGLAVHPDLVGLRARLNDALARLKSDTVHATVPDVDNEWRTLRARLHPASNQHTRKRSRPQMLWFGSSLAAAAAVALIFFNAEPPAPSASLPAAETARADYVEAGNVNASTMVYVDKESGWLVVWAADPTAPGKS